MPERLPHKVSEAFLPHPPRLIGVAVSGGRDSTALLHLMDEFSRLHRIELRAVTVDHGLRPEAADEARTVARQCAKIGVPHETLAWKGWCGKGNLQKAARDGRYGVMAGWARKNDIEMIAIGHTADDQAETFLMRLARSSGVDGLSSMRHRVVRDGVTWVRPLLGTKRDTLSSYLSERNISWVDDPSNDNDKFDRIKARKALTLLSELGISQKVLSDVAGHLGEARQALDWQTFLAAKQIAKIDCGAVVLGKTGLRLQPEEIQRRLLVRAIQWVGGCTYPPRRAALARLMVSIRNEEAFTLNGCHVRPIASHIWIFREYKAVRDLSVPTHAVWDKNWEMHPHVLAQQRPDLCIRALGPDGLDQCPDWRATGRPKLVLKSTPSIWRGDELVAAPLAGHEQSWLARLVGGDDAFFAALIAH